MQWLRALDVGVFHFINGSLGNRFFDWLMPILSGANGAMRWFVLAVVLGLAAALIFGSARARICAVMIFLAVALGDGLVINTIKHAVARPRPGIALSNVVMRLGSTASGSMPSAHAANWFAAAMLIFIFFRRRLSVMLPVACMAGAVAFSRVYNGVHYPSDVLAGAILGAGYAAALAMGLEWAWQYLGRFWFPLWHARMPSLLNPEAKGAVPAKTDEAEDSHWLRLAQILILVGLIGKCIYLASGIIQLSGDEAYQWLWSKHLALSYYSKPPGIAFIQFAGTELFGDNELGVRFFSPVFAAILSWITLQFVAREAGGKAAFWFLLIVNAVPLLALGSIVITVDPPLVLCWTWALLAGWRAVQADGRARDWLSAGVAMGLAFLCKYSALYQIVCFAIFFALWAPARAQLRRPGPWLALGIFLLCALPVIIWNAQHHWITVQHVKGNAGFGDEYVWKPTLKYFGEFWAVEAAALNPIFFIGAMWAVFGFWKRRREQPLLLYLFCMSAPVFFGHALYSFRERILPNWIAPAVPGLFLLMVLYWNGRLRAGALWIKPLLAAGLAAGFLCVAILYDTGLIGKIAGAPLPGPLEPTRRLHGWDNAAAVVEGERKKLAARGTPAFIIAGDYGMTSEFTFYLPIARKAEELHRPLVFWIDDAPTSQFYFWPEYDYRARHKGENAIYVMDIGPGSVEKGWFWKWLRHKPIELVSPPMKLPWPGWKPPVTSEFESVQDLGRREILVKGQVYHRVHLWACYHLK